MNIAELKGEAETVKTLEPCSRSPQKNKEDDECEMEAASLGQSTQPDPGINGGNSIRCS